MHTFGAPLKKGVKKRLCEYVILLKSKEKVSGCMMGILACVANIVIFSLFSSCLRIMVIIGVEKQFCAFLI